MQIACVLYRPFTSLDLIGAYQVFAGWPDTTVELVSDTREVVMDDVGVMSFTPTATFAEVTAPDVVLVPGSSRPFASLGDETLLAWLRAVEPTAKWMTSVCTGAGLLAAAGLITGRKCATHWAYREVVAGTGAEGGTPQRTNYQGEVKQDANPFKMFAPVLKMLAVQEVGAYAVRIDWSDGHNTGIYSFRHLRKICPCESCVVGLVTRYATLEPTD